MIDSIKLIKLGLELMLFHYQQKQSFWTAMKMKKKKRKKGKNVLLRDSNTNTGKLDFIKHNTTT